MVVSSFSCKLLLNPYSILTFLSISVLTLIFIPPTFLLLPAGGSPGITLSGAWQKLVCMEMPLFHSSLSVIAVHLCDCQGLRFSLPRFLFGSWWGIGFVFAHCFFPSVLELL